MVTFNGESYEVLDMSEQGVRFSISRHRCLYLARREPVQIELTDGRTQTATVNIGMLPSQVVFIEFEPLRDPEPFFVAFTWREKTFPVLQQNQRWEIMDEEKTILAAVGEVKCKMVWPDREVAEVRGRIYRLHRESVILLLSVFVPFDKVMREQIRMLTAYGKFED